MKAGADDLFGGGPAPPPPPDPVARLRRLVIAAWAGSLLCCPPVFLPFTSIFSLYVWVRAGEEVERARQGVHPPAAGRGLLRLRRLMWGLLLVDCLLMIATLAGGGLLWSWFAPEAVPVP